MAIQQDWKIRPRAHACSHTGRPFEDGETICAALFLDPRTGELTRQDFCLEAWDGLRDSAEPFSFWKSVYESPPPPESKETVAKETAESLLRRLVDEDEPGTENARYILAVMLERKRQLRQTDTRLTDDSRLLIYEHARTGDVFIVRDPELRLDEVDRVQAEVATLLAGPRPTEPDDTPPVPESGEPPAAEPGAGDATPAPAPEDAGSESSP